MNCDPIRDIVSGDFQLLETGERIDCPIRCLAIEPSLDGSERDLVGRLDFSSSLAIVCDPNTYDALAKRIAAALPQAKLVVIDTPAADEAAANALTDRTRHAEALIAVGAGTLNDLVKYVSHRRQRPYAVFATAPSMNGYVTATASISRGGEKLSLPATPPKGAFFDLTVLANAPRRLVRAGVGDSLCRTTAEIDWQLSHILFDTQFLETPFAIQAADETDLLTRIGDLEQGDLGATRALVRLLVLGGLGMLIASSSQPGSQGEHLISHYIDMVCMPHPGSLHGEQVGLAIRTMASLQHLVLSRDDPPELAAITVDPAEMERRLGSLGAPCAAALASKASAGQRLDALNRHLIECWPVLRTAFAKRALPLSKLLDALDRAAVASNPEDLGLAVPFYREAILHARELRDRFTMLDLAAHAGMLVPFVDEKVGMHDAAGDRPLDPASGNSQAPKPGR